MIVDMMVDCRTIWDAGIAKFFSSCQASKAGLRIFRPGLKMEEEESQGWLSWVWSWGGEAAQTQKEAKTGGRQEV